MKMDNKENGLLRRRQDQTDLGLRAYVNDVAGNWASTSRDMHPNKTRIVDEQNKMIDKMNLRK
ncbi:hypothetical protein [Gorillibacterium massiliense]|uniref:hypothetical protein n=1 Tax=Gorillibacterium massiliense TaxID=1280390 RepID=UPI0004B74D39|nr:hypothetical protein [Gorillibacterium massiliense]